MTILTYHSIPQVGHSPYAVPAAAFRERMQWLASRGLSAISLEQALEREPAASQIVLTFDDAYRSIVEHAVPVLLDLPQRLVLPRAQIDASTDLAGFAALLGGEGVAVRQSDA